VHCGKLRQVPTKRFQWPTTSCRRNIRCGTTSPAAVRAPAAISCLALTDATSDATLDALQALAARAGQPLAIDRRAPHVVLELPQLRVKCERHGEFVSLVFVAEDAALGYAQIAAGATFPSALERLPRDWLAGLPGRVMAATDIALVPFGDAEPDTRAIARWLDPDLLAGSHVLDEAAWVFSDFAVKDGGRTRWIVLDVRMGPAQTARLVQRLIEIEIYRMMALLAFPLARAAFPQLNRVELELERLTSATAELHAEIGTPGAQSEERRMLDELSRLAAEVESSVAGTAFRFSAAGAYWDIVRSRIAEFREQRLGDLRTLGGFLKRRMEPAMNSCAAAARRHDELSARIARASALLRTRVDIAREEQNQRVLAAMERRGLQQLRLQQTVEGLSVAAITYYLVGLVGTAARPLVAWWPTLRPDYVTAASIPVVGLLVWWAVRRIRRRLDLET
jgi:uncharacterized membrane-anchored protein